MKIQMRDGSALWRVVLVLAVAMIVAGAWHFFRPRPLAPPPPQREVKPQVESPAHREVANPPPAARPASPVDARLAGERLEAAVAALEASSDAEENRKRLAELRAFLGALAPAEASRVVRAFLAAGRDAGTRLDLTIGDGGALADASSLRVFLLDFLGLVDRPAAGVLAREILSTPTQPDEWAVSLRNVAWADPSPGGQEFLRTKTREMLGHAAWREKPSAGFLEAFDAVVHTRDFAFTPQLAEMVRDREKRALGHAAYLTMDRLAIADAASALEPLLAQPELMEGREKTRANFLARADVRDQRQRELVERYLLDPRRSADELATFAGLFPNANYMISKNLLTTVVTPAHDEIAVRDRAALARVEEWLADPRFERLRPQIEAIRGRLRGFVEQAGK
jgi:hypothetical protein